MGFLFESHNGSGFPSESPVGASNEPIIDESEIEPEVVNNTTDTSDS